MVVALGIAFRSKPVERIAVDLIDGPRTEQVRAALADQPKFVLQVHDESECRVRLRTGKTDLVVAATADTSEPPGEISADGEWNFAYYFDPARPESLLARNAVDDALERYLGRRDVAVATDHAIDEPGGRYIDFLVPGLLGMSLMGGGLWGVGFVTVDMRIRKLLKRFLATPMKKRDFLAGIMISRLLFMVPEVLVLLVFSRLAFGVVMHGSLWSVVLLVVLGAGAFSGIGLLVASRARTIEAVSGLMNLVMLPMWMLSGIFFSSDRFPSVVQPAIKMLPLTLLIDALRAVMLEGATLASQLPQIGGLAVWGGVSFALALRLFRWT
jgi:ABC-2 type transport system permease protein